MKSALYEIKHGTDFEAARAKILAHIDEYDISELILPAGEKPYFEECARVFLDLPIAIIEKYADALLAWFQDLNWPGINAIEKALLRLPTDVLDAAVQRAYWRTAENHDEEWQANLKEWYSFRKI